MRRKWRIRLFQAGYVFIASYSHKLIPCNHNHNSLRPPRDPSSSTANTQGSWSGKGTKKRKTNPKFLKTTPGLLETERKDAKFQNVIISEKKDKKASAFQVKDLPYPYTSVAQYEKRFENPLGAEWNSRAGHQRGTLPRVTKKVSLGFLGCEWVLMSRRGLLSSLFGDCSRYLPRGTILAVWGGSRYGERTRIRSCRLTAMTLGRGECHVCAEDRSVILDDVWISDFRVCLCDFTSPYGEFA